MGLSNPFSDMCWKRVYGPPWHNTYYTCIIRLRIHAHTPSKSACATPHKPYGAPYDSVSFYLGPHHSLAPRRYGNIESFFWLCAENGLRHAVTRSVLYMYNTSPNTCPHITKIRLRYTTQTCCAPIRMWAYIRHQNCSGTLCRKRGTARPSVNFATHCQLPNTTHQIAKWPCIYSALAWR